MRGAALVDVEARGAQGGLEAGAEELEAGADFEDAVLDVEAGAAEDLGGGVAGVGVALVGGGIDATFHQSHRVPHSGHTPRGPRGYPHVTHNPLPRFLHCRTPLHTRGTPTSNAATSPA